MDLGLTVTVAALVMWLTLRGIPTQTRCEKIKVYTVGAIALLLIIVQGYRNQQVQQEIRDGIAMITGQARNANLRYYCGQTDITGTGREIEVLWIPSNIVATPPVWAVNVGTGDAINVTGRLDVKENLPSLPITGNKEYPHSLSWSIPLLHPNDPQIISGGSSWIPERLAKMSLKMEAHYNGPTAVSEFVVSLKPILGPSYPPGYLPCPRPQLGG